MLRLLSSSFSRLSVSSNIASCKLHTSSQLNFHYTPVLFAEPLKKKKKLDPAIVRAREDRKRKKLEKQIRRLEKNSRQLKPIDELEVPLNLMDEKELRTRKIPKVSEEEQERRQLLMKKWASYRMEENLQDFKILDKLVIAQTKALNELKLESEELYQQAVQTDMDMIPIVVTGPMRTPPIKDYDYVDGDYNNVTKIYEGENKQS